MKHIVQNANSASYVTAAFTKELNNRIVEQIAIDYPEIVDKDDLGEGFVPVVVNTSDKIFWDINEEKYFNLDTQEHLNEDEMKELNLSESFEDHNVELAKTTLDLVDLARDGQVSAIQEKVAIAFEQALQSIVEEEVLDLNGEIDEENMSEAKIITKVNSRGEKRRRLSCRPGYELKDGVCVIVSGAKKINKKRSAIKAARTKRSKGAGYALKINKKSKKALKRRHGLGLDHK